jgi:methionine-rich copper-binding protein CopC
MYLSVGNVKHLVLYFSKRIERGFSRIKLINADDNLCGFNTDFIHA